MDLRKIKKLIELLEESNIGELEIKEGEDSVRISRVGSAAAAPVYAAPAPIAAAIGSSIKYTSRAPAPSADSLIARRSTWVEPQGTHTSTRGLGRKKLLS